MKSSTWEAIPKESRDVIVAVFKMAQIDFEREYVISDETQPRQFETSPWMTRAEAARYAHVSMDTIDNWCRAKYIDHSKLGAGKAGGVLILRDSLEKFLRSKIDNRSKRIRIAAPSVNGGYRVQHSK